METRAETEVCVPSGTPFVTREAVYSVIAGLAAVTSVGMWLLLVVDEGRDIGAATVDLAVKFTNVTVLLVTLVAAWIASGLSPGQARAVAHLTVMLMAVVTAVVNATLLDPALPGGWWGVVDLSQHYVIPLAVVASWATLGPPVDLPRSRHGLILVAPLTWFVFVLVRGLMTDSYPYDFVDVAENGWPKVLAAVAVIVVFMFALGTGAATIDSRRHGVRARHH
jgi:hypothetical protein